MGQRLLIVDSDRRFIQDHQAALESTFEVDFLFSTEGALAHLESGQYSAVLLCVEVSENKGYSLCSTLRKAPATQHLKVALISGKATQEEYARHQSLKGRADLYLHKPIATSALIAALSRFVPVKMEDPDNPLGDLGGPEAAEEWLESLKTELELDGAPGNKPAPEAASVFSLPLPPLSLPFQATQILPIVPSAGHVELLEARIQDLEGKLVAKADELDEALKELAELNQRHDSATRNLGDLEQVHAATEGARQAVTALEARVQDLEAELEASTGITARQMEARDIALARQRELEAQVAGLQEDLNTARAGQGPQAEALDAARAEQARLAEALEAARAEQARLAEALEAAHAEQARQAEALEAARAQVEEQARLSMDSMEANMLLQAQMEEAREKAVEHLETARSLQEAQESRTRTEALLEEKETLCRELQERCGQQEQMLGELEAKCGECSMNRERLQASFAELEHQLATLEDNHERQRLELMAGIDEREGQLGRLNATLDAQQERLLTMEHQKADTDARAQAHADRLRTLHGLLADLEGKAREGRELSDFPTE